MFEKTRAVIQENREFLLRTGAVISGSALALAIVMQGDNPDPKAPQHVKISGTDYTVSILALTGNTGPKDFAVDAKTDVEVLDKISTVTVIQDMASKVPIIGQIVREPSKHKISVTAPTSLHFDSCDSLEIKIMSGDAPMAGTLGKYALNRRSILVREFMPTDNEILRCGVGTIVPPEFVYPAGTLELPDDYSLTLTAK